MNTPAKHPTLFLIKTLAGLLFVGISSLALAETKKVATPMPEWDSVQLQAALSKAASGNAEEGKRLNHYLYCSACHGDNGNSPSRNWPSLTGQKPDYVMKTLLDYKRDMRRDHYRKAYVMTRMSQLLSEQQMADLATYYAQQPAPVVPPQTNLKLAKQGANLANQGDDKRGISACTTCHGEQGESGITPETPALAGQTPEYFIQAMQMYKAGMRTSDVGGVMRMFAKGLTTSEITALAHYYASLGSKRNMQ
ncbi:MAG: cytochrome c4 [Betaproteobacteria bacterium]|nr:MAG: cytochrome c4 [Betaproteobacteria bacterium]